MAIELKHSQSPEMSAFISNMHTTNTNVRLVRYYAVAQVAVSHFVEVKSSVENRSQLLLDLNKMVDILCETTVIDRALFKSIITKMYEFYSNKTSIGSIKENIVAADNFLDILGLGRFFSSDDIFMINKNFPEYKNTLIITMKVINSILPEGLI